MPSPYGPMRRTCRWVSFARRSTIIAVVADRRIAGVRHEPSGQQTPLRGLRTRHGIFQPGVALAPEVARQCGTGTRGLRQPVDAGGAACARHSARIRGSAVSVETGSSPVSVEPRRRIPDCPAACGMRVFSEEKQTASGLPKRLPGQWSRQIHRNLSTTDSIRNCWGTTRNCNCKDAVKFI